MIARCLGLGLSCFSLAACASTDFYGVDAASARESFAEAKPTTAVSLSGTYSSPESGTLWLWQDGEQLSGRYELRKCEYQMLGFVSGQVHGNRAEVSWSESQRLSGKLRRYESDGYFYFAANPELGSAPRLLGQQNYFVTLPGSGGSGSSKRYTHSIVWTATQLGRSLDLPLTSVPERCVASQDSKP